MAQNCPQKSISSDFTTLAYSIEKCLNEAQTTPVWKPLEPNSIDSYGATVTTATRNPIGTGRQRIKGEMIDLEAAVGYTSDLTSRGHQDFIKGFLLADDRQQVNVVNATAGDVIDSATVSSVDVTDATVFKTGDILLCEGFGAEANNKVRVVTTAIGSTITFVDSGGAVEAIVPAGASIHKVGYEGASAELQLTVVGGKLRLTGTAGLTAAVPVQAGDWIYIGGEAAVNKFTGYTGFARVGAKDAAGWIEFDRVLGTFAADAGTGKAIRVFVSTSIRNPDKQSDMARWSFEFEQQLGSDADGVQSRYVTGAMANEFTLTVPAADKVTAQFGFVACDEAVRTGAQGLKAGTREPMITYPMFNAGRSDNRVWLHKAGDAAPLFAYATNATVTINNGMTGVKAIGVTGNLDINVGTFEVGGSVTAYFLDVRSIDAIRSNADVSGTVALFGKNTGVVFDMPKMGLSNGQTAIEVGNPVTIALDMAAVRNDLGYTLQYCYFPYLP